LILAFAALIFPYNFDSANNTDVTIATAARKEMLLLGEVFLLNLLPPDYWWV
jgi:hypothetical protein